jgi:hypothetical protein
MSDHDETPEKGSAEYTHQAHVAVHEALKDADGTLEPSVDLDRTKETKTPGFSRMRTEWSPHDVPVIEAIRNIVDKQITQVFIDAYEVMNDLYTIVREPEVDESTGEILTDRFGYARWKTKPTGEFIEDYSLLGHKEREDFVFRIATRLFDWRQKAADLWGDAMFAKAQWEEAMAIGFDEPEGRLTIDARTHKGRLYSRDARYFAIFQSLLSRRADSVVKSMEEIELRLSQRLD